MTLHYYSPKDYEFAHKIFGLPHSSSVRTWAASVDCEPGYLMNVIQLLGKTLQEKKWMSDVLVVDGMKLCSEAVWGPKAWKFVGNIDYGTAIPELVDGEATEALVFMVVGMTGNWKHPIVYVLQDKCTTGVQAQQIKDCIRLLHTEGFQVLAVVFNWTYTSQSTAKHLGFKMKVSEFHTWFQHPQKPESKIHVIFDACHMIQLMRNLLGDYKTIFHKVDDEQQEIKWQYTEDLNTGFTFANKLKWKHIVWTKHKMNVSMAAQTLSHCVASAIDFL